MEHETSKSAKTKKVLENIMIYLWPELIMIAIAFFLGRWSQLGSVGLVWLTIFVTAQNGSFVLTSRARQSSNLKLHAIMALGSNGFFIFIITAFAVEYNNVWLKIWYTLCTTVSAVHAHYISLHKIEAMPYFRNDSLVTHGEFLHIAEAIDNMKREIENLREELDTVRSTTSDKPMVMPTI